MRTVLGILGASIGRLGAVCSYQGNSPEQRQTAVASGVEVADVLERARPSSWHWEMRQAMRNKLACSGSRGAVGRRRNWSEKFVGAEGFEQAIVAAWWLSWGGNWGKERGERGD